MIHTFVGNFGHALVIVAFVSALLSALSYWQAERLALPEEQRSWMRLARTSFGLHGLSVLGVVGALFWIIYAHYYEYHYAWSHSSNNLPVHFMISCFWEGQEGSFLLWVFWHVIVAALLIPKAGKWEAPVMLVFALVQAFLVSMVLGIDLLGLKVGSSPFILLRDAITSPMFATNPNYVPEDGTGLNPLLQNIWMVIHPPTLFLGFALTLVPFSFVIASLLRRDYSGWVKPVMSWVHVGALILGLGIMMGAYWAYETLNFGGYWNWDPVENAVYVPWLVLVATAHLLVIFRRSGRGLKAAMILSLFTFALILYSTFLTRSGVLGEASVHSFTDLGLSGQLLVYLLFFTLMAVVLLALRWKEIPSKPEEASVYSSDFWMFLGATMLCLAAFQVIVPTSIPAWNAFWKALGVSSSVAPPADAVAFYTKFQLWFSVGIALLTGTGQMFFWNRVDGKNLTQVFAIPLVAALLGTTALLMTGKVQNPTYIALLTASIYAIVANGAILLKLLRSNALLSGGAVAHMGLAVMLIGILYSSGYEKIISLNLSGKVYNSEFPEEMNKQNLLLFRGQPKQMQEYLLTYQGPRLTSEDVPGYIDKEILLPTADPYRAVALQDIAQGGKTYAKKGDTIQVYHENVYYEISYKRTDGKTFTLFPRVQENPQMGVLPSPDVASYWDMDLYTHITNLAVDEQELKWSEPEELKLHIGDTTLLHDYFVVFDGVAPQAQVPGMQLQPTDVAVQANLRALSLDEEHTDLKPLFVIKGGTELGMVPATSRKLGLKLMLKHIDPQQGVFTFEARTAQKDWIILKAVEKPFVNLLWIGTLMVCAGFGLAAFRRAKEEQPAPKPQKQAA